MVLRRQGTLCALLHAGDAMELIAVMNSLLGQPAYELQCC